jgi:hypothetical protein
MMIYRLLFFLKKTMKSKNIHHNYYTLKKVLFLEIINEIEHIQTIDFPQVNRVVKYNVYGYIRFQIVYLEFLVAEIICPLVEST